MTLHCERSKLRSIFCILSLYFAVFVTLGHAEHRDAAPMSDEVKERFAKNRHQPGNPLVETLGRHLDEAGDLLRQVEENDKSVSANGDVERTLNVKRTLIAAKLNELASIRTELRKEIAETRAKFVSLGLSDKVKEWDAFINKVDDRFDRISNALGNVRTFKDKAGRGKALTKAKLELHDLHGKVRERQNAMPSGPIPTWTQENREIKEEKEIEAPSPAYLSYQPKAGNNVYAFLGNTILAADSTPIEAASCNYTALDLAESQEVKLTQEIRDLAARLGYSPARIFEYVYNNFKFEPYYGSLKGATGTLVAGGGNDTD